MIVDKDRNLIKVNPKFCETLGYSEEELIGNNAVMIHISEETYAEFGESAFNQVRKKQPVNLEWPLCLIMGIILLYLFDLLTITPPSPIVVIFLCE